MLIKVLDTCVSIVPSFHKLTRHIDLPPYIKETINSADRVYFECDLEKPFIPNKIFSATIHDLLPLEEVVTLTKLWSANAINRSAGDLHTMSAGEIAEIVTGCTDEYTFKLLLSWGIDHRLWNLVDSKKRRSLQSNEELQHFMDVYPEDEQVADLRYACDLPQRSKDFNAELQAWKDGQASDLGLLTDEIYRRTPLRAESVLHKRNVVMLCEIESAICERNIKSVFVLGAAHVVGRHGILAAFDHMGRMYKTIPAIE